MSSADAAYDDPYCQVCKGTLILKWHYFPTAQSKNIPIKEIRAIYYRQQNIRMDCAKAKGWGMSFSPCWWACDFYRGCPRRGDMCVNVVVDCGEKTYKGFTTLNVDKLLDQIRPQLTDNVEIVAGELPF